MVIALFVFCLGAPLFLYTTRVHRADLPVLELDQRVETFADSVKFRIPVYVNSTNEAAIAQIQSATDNYISTTTNLDLLWSLEFRPYTQEIDSYQDYVLSLIEDDESSLDHLTQSFVLSPFSKGITVVLPSSLSISNVSQYVTEVLFNQVFGSEIQMFSALKSNSLSSDMSFPYSTVFNVVFNLFVQDGTPVDWAIAEAVPLMQPIFQALQHYCKFKVSTQIQYYSKLTNEPTFNEEQNANIISQENLPTFVNFGDWNLHNHEVTPSINFVIYFSELNYENIPLLVEGSETNSFSIPQWGGVYIYNPALPPLEGSRIKISESELNKILDIFASQLFELLGVPSEPVSPLMRIDSFQRFSSYKNLKRSLDNLSALVKLSNSLIGISIPEATKTNVVDSMARFDEAVQNLSVADFSHALENSGISLESSDKAFFEKEMLQQAHFPNEHKLAIFLPLLGPICSIVLFGILKRFIAWKKNRSALSQTEKAKKEI